MDEESEYIISQRINNKKIKIMEQKELVEQQLRTYVENLQDVIDVLISIEPQNPDTWDESILRAIREVNEVKCYFKNQL